MKYLLAVAVVLLLACFVLGNEGDVNKETTQFLLKTVTGEESVEVKSVLSHFSEESEGFKLHLSKYLEDGQIYSSEEQFNSLYLRLTILAARQDFLHTANYTFKQLKKLNIEVVNLKFYQNNVQSNLPGRLNVYVNSHTSTSNDQPATPDQDHELRSIFQNLLRFRSISHPKELKTTTSPIAPPAPFHLSTSHPLYSSLTSAATEALPSSFSPYTLSPDSIPTLESYSSIPSKEPHFILSIFYHPFQKTYLFVTYTSPLASSIREDIYTLKFNSTTTTSIQYQVKVHHTSTFDSFFISSIISIGDHHQQNKRAENSNDNVAKIMSYNIWSGDVPLYPWNERKTLIANIIKKYSPDIVGIQEIRRVLSDPNSNRLLQISSIINDPSWSYIYQGAMTYQGNGIVTEEGLGILTKHKFVADTVRFTRLTLTNQQDGNGDQDLNTRIVLRAVIDLTWDKIDFFVTHWSYARGGQYSNAVETFDYTNSFLSNEKYLQVLVADFNIYPDFTKPADFMNGKSMINGKTGNWTDTWGVVHDKSDKNGYTFSNLPGKQFVDRADRVMIRIPESLKKDSWEVAVSRRVGWAVDQPGQKPPSDHLAVLAYLHKK
eukprot:TRINITY_DN2555_c0_g1_i2.p1 TRINITY_DN2555_c0_g1~~TRINITY_DN2555_c0_g1_i2.p1  ORF type:complete len:603 (-),score=122.17 TRINITY_DN2555_c0_g1_i2:61-1869(-)